MRRKPGAILPLELEILEASLELRRGGTPDAHGFLLARVVGDRTGAKRLTAYGTLYKALDRLERAGHLESRWEDPQSAAVEHRPRRRFYRITIVGESALADQGSARSLAPAVPARAPVT